MRRQSPRGLVLLYHRVAGPRFDPLLLDVAPSNFAGQLDVLRVDATVLALEEFEHLRRCGSLPDRAVAITFDDGYADNLHAAAPLLAGTRMPATIFVASGAVGSAGEFWWDDVERIVCTTAALSSPAPIPTSWPGEDGAGAPGLKWSIETRGPASARQNLYHALLAHLRALNETARRSALDALRAWAGVPNAARESHRTVTNEECRGLAAMDGITIGAHTVTHPVLSRLNRPDQLREMTESRTELGAITGRPVNLLAYPFGTRGDLNADSLAGAEAAGFAAAYANDARCAWRWSSRWRVPRVLVRDWAASEFRQRLAGWWAL